MYKRLFTILFVLIFGTLSAQVRQKIAINTNWSFYKGDKIETIEEELWKAITIPHTWNAEDVLDDTPGLYTGIGWYKKTLFIPEIMQGKQIYLYFEGVNQAATIYVNGKEIGIHHGGYTAFCFNITSAINGKQDDLVVKVDNRFNLEVPPIGGDMERFGGIYRDVFLLAINEAHFDIDFFASSGIFVTTPEVSDKSALININSRFQYREGYKLTLKHEILDQFGNVKNSVEKRISKAFETPVSLQTKIDNPMLWSPSKPNLYKIRSQLIDQNGNIVDEVVQNFGVRTLDTHADKGIILNGNPIFIKGIGKHQDYDGIGYAVPNEILKKDVHLIKEMGANLLRAHYPLDPATYDECDKEGVMVWGKIPIMDKVDHSKEFLANTRNMMQELIYQNYNRPSFILWGFACEIFGDMDWYWSKPQDPLAVQENLSLTEKFSIEMEDFMREIDPYRLTANDFHTDPTPEFYKQAAQTSLHMVNGWNIYQGWYHNNLDSIASVLRNFRDYNLEVPFVLAEFGAGSDPRIHTYLPTIYDFSTEYQDKFHETYLTKVDELEFVHGMCIWTLFDFQVASRADAVPHINSKGMLRADRTPKDAYYLYQAHWSDKPMLHIASRDWTMRKEIVVEDTAWRNIRVYSNLNEVSLLLNGKTLGKKKNASKVFQWEVPFTNGINHLQACSFQQETFFSDVLTVEFEFIPEDFSKHGFPEEGLCINVGQSRSFFSDNLKGGIWMPDKDYQKGNYGHIDGDYFTKYPSMLAWDGIRQGIGQNMLATDLDPVFQTFLMGNTDYKIDVPKGRYEVSLLFAEPFGEEVRKKDSLFTGTGKEGKRLFDVMVNNIKVFDSLNLAGQYGDLTAVERTVLIDTEKGINVKLSPIEGSPVLSGIKLLRID